MPCVAGRAEGREGGVCRCRFQDHRIDCSRIVFTCPPAARRSHLPPPPPCRTLLRLHAALASACPACTRCS
jgi:hypothetical protein